MSENKRKLTRSDITSFLAVIFSIAALVVSMIQARIMAEQQTVMVAQQKAAVWPYVELSNGLNLTDSIVYKVVAENKGVGPAIVKDMSIAIHDEVYENFDEFSMALDSLLGREGYSVRRFGVNKSRKAVYKPSEQKTLFEVIIFDPVAYRDKVGFFNVSLTYCSIYDDCWKDNGEEIVPD